MVLRLPGPMHLAHPGGKRAGDSIAGRQQLLGLGQAHLRRFGRRRERHCPGRLTNSRHRRPRRRPHTTITLEDTVEGTVRRTTLRTVRHATGCTLGITITARIRTPAGITLASARGTTRSTIRHTVGSAHLRLAVVTTRTLSHPRNDDRDEFTGG
ncbi:hypothetical protein Mame01_57390 [Microbispora amethystogenes]|nr:hypothetical protein Mame01_57390 [Microbispora amethystogenes]